MSRRGGPFVKSGKSRDSQPKITDGPRYLIRTPKVPVHSGAWQLVGTPAGVPLSGLEILGGPTWAV